MAEDDTPLPEADAIRLVTARLMSGPGPGPDDFDARLGLFAEALGHLVRVARFYSVGEGDRQGPDLEPRFGVVLRRAFEEADRVRYELPTPWVYSLSGAPPPGREAVHAGVELFDRTMRGAWERWGCARQWYRRGGGTPWLGRLYPRDFPWRDAVARGDLDALKAALELLALPVPGAGEPAKKIDPPTHEPDTPRGARNRYAYEEYQKGTDRKVILSYIQARHKDSRWPYLRNAGSSLMGAIRSYANGFHPPLKITPGKGGRPRKK